MERPKPDDSDLRPEVAPGTDGRRGPGDPKPDHPIVTPLDDGKHIEKGIDIEET